MAIFVRIIELGSLSAAGRDMRLSPAVVSNRVARLEGSLGVRLLNRTTRRVIVAAPSYLARHPAPKEPADLLKHNCLLLRFPGSRQYRWTLQGPDGPMTLRVAGSMDANNGEVLRDWCLAGHGLALKSL